MPYEGMVSNDPSFEEMRRVICEEEKRPPIDSAWITDSQVRLAAVIKNNLKITLIISFAEGIFENLELSK